MDFFADGGGLPDQIVLHVMDYLDNDSLLKLAKCNKRLKKLLGSEKFASRFSLHLNFMRWYNESNFEPITVADIEAIHERILSSGRKYRNLTVDNSIRATEVRNEDFQPAAFSLLRMLGESVKEVYIHKYYERSSNIFDFAQLLFAFRNVTKYKLFKCLENLLYGYNEFNRCWRNGEFDFMENVEELEVNRSNECILYALSSCLRLKRFAMIECYGMLSCHKFLNEFLNRQTQLEHLEIVDDRRSIDLADWLTFNFKLKCLHLWHTEIDLNAVPLFFEQQNELQLLEIPISYGSFKTDEETNRERRKLFNAITAIWKLPKLTKLTMNFSYYHYRPQLILPESFFDDLPRNNTIESISVYCSFKNFVRLFNSMDAVKRIEVRCNGFPLDLSDWRLDVIAKITKFHSYHLIYTPEEAPEDRVEFEKIFSKLFRRRCQFGVLSNISIGHPSWLRHQDEFQLSLGFCKNLLNAFPYLKELKLYNVHPRFAAYLDTNKPEYLKVIELH